MKEELRIMLTRQGRAVHVAPFSFYVFPLHFYFSKCAVPCPGVLLHVVQPLAVCSHENGLMLVAIRVCFI